jgi:transposase
VATILALARFCEPSSELHIADTWYRRTALEDLLGASVEQVNEDRLYRGLDQVLPHKEAIEKHLREQFADLFDAQFDLILYDVTSTYFEGEAEGNPQAQRGHSRDKRYDCKQVCIGLVVTRDGLPLSYEVFAGNTNDMKTLKEIVQAMERKHGKLGRIWVVDRGIASEENLQYLRDRGAQYVVGTPKNQLKKFESSLHEAGWSEVQPGVEVKLCPGPDGTETFILCRSRDRREKEKAMHERFTQRIEKGLNTLWDRLSRARKMPDRVEVGKQIGRLLGKNSRAAGLFDIQVTEVEENGQKKLKLTWEKRKEWSDWAELSEGSYLLRTNLVGWSPQDLWKTYIQLTQAESAFRVQKSELKIRPIWHQKEHRVQAHILFSFLAYAMWKTLEQWMARCGLGNGPRTVVEEIAKIKAANVILPTSAGRDVQLRCVTKPDNGQRVLLSHLGLKIPERLGAPKWKDLIPKM